MDVIARAVFLGMAVMLAGTIPRNIVFAANLRHGASVPWTVPVIAAYLWFLWRYLGGAGPPAATAEERARSLRAHDVSGAAWVWALLAGVLGIVALVIGLRLLSRLVVLPQQQLPDLSHVSRFTIFALLLMAAPVAGIVEEAAFRGYMQGPIERRYGLPIAVLITGTMFAVAHLDFTPILWPYYVTVAALYGVVTSRTNSILPAIVLHTAGNTFSNLDLLLNGQSEWQAAGRTTPIWQTGIDASSVQSLIALVMVSALMVFAFRRLRRHTQPLHDGVDAFQGRRDLR
jgi:membrane protease YdiL (CAAX protease family)